MTGIHREYGLWHVGDEWRAYCMGCGWRSDLHATSAEAQAAAAGHAIAVELVTSALSGEQPWAR